VTVLGPGPATTKVNAPGVTPATADLDNLVEAVHDALTTLGAGNGPERTSDPAETWLLICGSFPPGTDVAALVGRLVATARTAGAKVAVDSSGTALRAAARAGVDLLTPNRSELAAAFGGTEPHRAAVEHGSPLLVSLGADGALWTDGVRSVRAQAPAVAPVNPAGAGDALLAGWFSLAAGTDVATRLATAVAWGTAACLVPTTVRTGDPAPDPGAVRVSEHADKGLG
jgi:1-phosphofructokinase